VATETMPPLDYVSRFRELAEDAQRYASTVSREDLRDTFLRIAQAWNTLVVETERTPLPSSEAEWPKGLEE
jgi:hypothetical protein